MGGGGETAGHVEFFHAFGVVGAGVWCASNPLPRPNLPRLTILQRLRAMLPLITRVLCTLELDIRGADVAGGGGEGVVCHCFFFSFSSLIILVCVL